MRKMIVTSLLTAVLVLAGIAGAAWATGVIDPMAVVNPPEVEGVFGVEGTVSIDGSEMSLPFKASLELIKDGDPQLRELSFGENGVSLTIPRVLQPQIAGAFQGWAKMIGDAASLGVGPLNMGFHLDALRVEFTVTFRGPVPNPYAYPDPEAVGP